MATPNVKHTLLARFNVDITPEKIHELIDAYSSLREKIQTIMSFRWGEDLHLEPPELNRGYTHAFESTFTSKEDLTEYLNSPELAEFYNKFLPCLKQRVVMDYVPRNVQE